MDIMCALAGQSNGRQEKKTFEAIKFLLNYNWEKGSVYDATEQKFNKTKKKKQQQPNNVKKKKKRNVHEAKIMHKHKKKKKTENNNSNQSIRHVDTSTDTYNIKRRKCRKKEHRESERTDERDRKVKEKRTECASNIYGWINL